MRARAVLGLPVSSIMTLKDQCFARFSFPEHMFDNLVAASLDKFPHRNEQQHVHFRWLGCRRKYPLTR
ncbi:hypothetical protein TNCV_4927561 [Trichonephila clavipes]|nr:hypothetical protein TNCV_4927561 [Trichonephila clavipes]